MRAKAGQSPSRTSNSSNINGKEASDMPRSPLSLQPKLTASMELQMNDSQIIGNYNDSTLCMTLCQLKLIQKQKPKTET
jgi:hypothetical protein